LTPIDARMSGAHRITLILGEGGVAGGRCCPALLAVFLGEEGRTPSTARAAYGERGRNPGKKYHEVARPIIKKKNALAEGKENA